ncbi:MAG: hypothetical protein ACKVOB_04375 [Sphingomonas sp.]
MTPLSLWLARIVPPSLVLPALAVIYAVMMLSLLLAGGGGGTDIAYVDVGRK